MTLDLSQQILLQYAPEHWGTVERFARFYTTTYDFDWQVRKRVSGISGNFAKAQQLLRVIQDLQPKISEDERELKVAGFSRGHRSRETAAVVEATFCSLYSTLDCFRWVFGAIYKKHRGIKESTRKLFQAGQEGTIDEKIPQLIRDQFLHSKTWFNELRSYRDEMTHSDVGNCHHDKSKLTYIHPGLGSPTKALVIDDVIGKIEGFATTINTFLGIVFQELNRTLKDDVTEQFCGIFGGRFYQRYVKPSEAVDFHGGRCKRLSGNHESS